MTIRIIMEERNAPQGIDAIYHCTGENSVAEAATMLAEKRIGALPVVDGERIIGIFSERDVLYCLKNHGAAMLDMKVRDVMTADVVSVDSSKSAIGALSLMTKRRIRHLPVVENDKLIGFVSIGDLVKYRIDKIETEAAAMRDYINTA